MQFFVWAGGCEIFCTFFGIKFHSIDEPSGLKNWFLTNLSKIYAFVQLFQTLVNFLQIPNYKTVIQ